MNDWVRILSVYIALVGLSAGLVDYVFCRIFPSLIETRIHAIIHLVPPAAITALTVNGILIIY
jgi:hypothetical protein